MTLSIDDELVTISQLPDSIGCALRFAWAMIRGGYQLKYRALRKTTLEWLAAKPEFKPHRHCMTPHDAKPSQKR